MNASSLSSRRWALVVALSFLAASLACGGPIGPFAGGRLSGQEGEWPIDWNAIANVDQLQLEASPDDPYSVNLWFAVYEDEAYIVSSLLMGTDDPEERAWVQKIGDDPRIRMGIGASVWPARLEPVTDTDLTRRVLQAFMEKYENVDELRGGKARYFRIVRP